MSQVINLRKKASDAQKPKINKDKVGVFVERPKKQEVKQDLETQKTKPKISVSWEAPSFHYNPSKKYLYPVLIAIFAVGVLIFLSENNILTGTFLMLSSLVLLLYSNKKPNIVSIDISTRGITVDDRIYHYRDLKSFWIHYEVGGIKELSLEPRRWYIPYIKIIINDHQNPLTIRSVLINFLPEREHEPSLIDVVARVLGL